MCLGLQRERVSHNLDLLAKAGRTAAPEKATGADALLVAIEDGDVLFVPSSRAAKVGRIVRAINPFGMQTTCKLFAMP